MKIARHIHERMWARDKKYKLRQKCLNINRK